LIVKLDEGTEVHKFEPVTVTVYVPAAMPEKSAVVPDATSVVPPGTRVTVQVPEAGRPLNATLPVARAQVGWVMVPITGAEGVEGCTGITTSAERVADTQPASFATE
jgi:hypothetical protein